MEPHIAEINLLGTGGGYGESLVIHLANNEWIVIDSCYDPNTKESLPLKFLKDRSVDLKNVKMIICTHWHDDHIRGLSELFEHTPNAIFSCSRAMDKKKFLQLVGLEYEKAKFSASNSSTKEFQRCLEVIENRGQTIKYSEVDKTLYTSSFQNKNLRIHSLSPSDYAVILFDQEISTLIDSFGKSNKKIPYLSLNDKSVVVLAELGCHTVLFGADLEVKSDTRLGWLDIIHNSQTVKLADKSSYFKIPHHGSNNGYHIDIWNNLLHPSPIGSLTPRHPKPRLPKKRMADKYRSLTSDLYFTSPSHKSSNPKKRDRRTAKFINKVNSTLEEIRFEFGLVSSRIDILDPNSTWKTTLKGKAFCYN